jgi:hypothetical protein
MVRRACDKLLVTHEGALSRKYSAAGLRTVRAALDELTAADADRGVGTKVLLLDNASTARSLGVPRVPDRDWAAAVRAVDRAAEAYEPAYIVLVGADDVVPQGRVSNPLQGIGEDLDPYLPSDLPYACDLPDDWAGTSDDLLDIAMLLSVTRVVGRLPDEVGASDPALLLSLLGTASHYEQRPASDYQSVFALSAAVWADSTSTSVDLLPGPAPKTRLSPPGHSGWTPDQLRGLSHFVNCHGGDVMADWFGQRDTNAPVDVVALAPEDVDGHVREGTVVVAECCYGAQHVGPGDLGGRMPMLWSYLRSGAYAALGSSTTAYGPATGNGQADLLCRFVLEGVMTGASSGRALLDARQRYLREVGAMGPEDLKTLGQFDLLGDPSLQPVAVPGRARAPSSGSKSVGKAPGLAQRRAVLRAAGRALASSVPRAGTAHRARTVDAPTLASEAGLANTDVVGDVVTFDEHREAPRAGYRFHVAPVRRDGRAGLVVSRETGGERRTSTVWRK